MFATHRLRVFRPHWVPLTAAVMLSACDSTLPIQPCHGKDKGELCLQASGKVPADSGAPHDGAERRWLAAYSAEPWAVNCAPNGDGTRCVRPSYGLALAGGGSKAAPFAVGAIKRLVDDGMWPSVDVLTSVSGGGYAAYFAYHKAVEQTRSEFRVGSRPLRYSDWFVDARREFKDCDGNGRCSLPEFTTPDLARGFGESSSDCRTFPSLASSFQKWVSCYQDLFAQSFGGNYWNLSGFPVGSYVGGAVTTLGSLPFHHAANTLFDWGAALSPSQFMYFGGIVRAYGLVPPVHDSISVPSLTQQEALDAAGRISFADLRQLYARTPTVTLPRMPYWVIQATNAVSSSSWFDVQNEPYDLAEAVFEIGAYGFGSGAYGYVRGGSLDALDEGFDVAQGVLASAAFLDPAQRVMKWNRGLVFLGLHGANLKWGLRVPNYNVAPGERVLRASLPFPLYYGHSFRTDKKNPYIRLADGGQSGDNLGLYAQLQRGVRHIVSIDGAFDLDAHDRSYLPELCTVDSYLREHHGVRLAFRGTPGSSTDDSTEFDVGPRCAQAKKQSEVGLLDCPADQESNCRPSPYRWKRKVWVGTVKPASEANIALSPLGQILAKEGDPTRIYYVKAAADYSYLMRMATKYFMTGDRCIGTAALDREVPCGLLHYFGGAETTVSSSRYKGKPHFPQGGTVELTADSNRQAYNAYLSLGWYLTGALCQQPELRDEKLCRPIGAQGQE